LRKLSTALKIIVSVAVLLFVFRKADLTEGIRRIGELRLSFILLSILLIVVGQVVRALRLAVMVFGGSAWQRLGDVLRIQMVSFLPGVISPAKVGEVAKVFMMRSELDVPTERGLACFVAERVLDLTLLGPLAAIGLYTFYRMGLDVDVSPGWLRVAALAVAMFLVAAAAGAVWARKRGISISELLKTASPAGLLEAGALTLLYWGIVFVEVWLFCKASGFDARILHMALVVPPALLSSMIPISFSGFGVRELAMVVLLQGAPVGMSYEQGLVVSLMYDIIGLGIPILMGIMFWLSKRQDGAPQA
jgi:uncharacterized membrane protein YbhN (UPF0104 family)